MSGDLAFIRTPYNTLEAVDETAEMAVRRIPVGDMGLFRPILGRDPIFHRRLMSLLNFAWQHWDGPEVVVWHGQKVGRSFHRFRKDLIIEAGYWEPVVDSYGDVRAEAMSLSFAKMDQAMIEALYSKLLDLIGARIAASGYDRDTLEALNEEWMRYARGA